MAALFVCSLVFSAIQLRKVANFQKQLRTNPEAAARTLQELAKSDKTGVISGLLEGELQSLARLDAAANPEGGPPSTPRRRPNTLPEEPGHGGAPPSTPGPAGPSGDEAQTDSIQQLLASALKQSETGGDEDKTDAIQRLLTSALKQSQEGGEPESDAAKTSAIMRLFGGAGGGPRASVFKPEPYDRGHVIFSGGKQKLTGSGAAVIIDQKTGKRYEIPGRKRRPPAKKSKSPARESKAKVLAKVKIPAKVDQTVQRVKERISVFLPNLEIAVAQDLESRKRRAYAMLLGTVIAGIFLLIVIRRRMMSS